MQSETQSDDKVEVKSDAAAEMFEHAAKLTAEPIVFVDAEDIEKK